MTQEIKRINSVVPVVLITGIVQDVTRPDLFEAILVKPFSAGDLLDRISRAVTG